MSDRRVLIIDDEEGVRTSLGLVLEDEGYTVRTAADAEAGLEQVEARDFDVIVCDVRMPGRSGLDLLPDLLSRRPEATVLMMSAYGAVDQALEAVRRGAYDYLAKPFQPEELLLTIRKAEERESLRDENRRLREALDEERGAGTLVAASDEMKAVVDLVDRAAGYKTTVLILGESGVGKEVVAGEIHARSDRAAGPFVAVNCGAIPESLVESELFGHARGAFTGADRAKPGLFREAEGGTLLLDEIGELSGPMQVKLLRALQEEEVQPVGEARPVAIDVRILAATARDLQSEIRTGRFRQDLFYRLDVVRIEIPPLRERRDDVPVLVEHLLARLSRRIGKRVSGIEPDALELLCEHAWPGNVRELENALERALILAPGGRITTDVLPLAAIGSMRTAEAGMDSPDSQAAVGLPDLSIKRATRELEERLIRQALERTGGNRTRAARILEISPRTIHYKLKEYGIEPLNPDDA